MPFTMHGWKYATAPQEWPRPQARCTGENCPDCVTERLLVDTTIVILAGEDPKEALENLPRSEQADAIARAIERAPALAEAVAAQLAEWHQEQ